MTIKKQILAYNSQFAINHFNEFKLAISFLLNNGKFNLYTKENILYNNKDIKIALDIINQSQALKIEILENYKNYIKIFDFIFDINQIFNYITNIGINDIILGTESLFAIQLEKKIKIKNNIAKIVIKNYDNLNIFINFLQIYMLNFKKPKNNNFIILKRDIDNQIIDDFSNLIIYLIYNFDNKINIYYYVEKDVF